MKYISFTKDDDYASRKAAIARQEKLAEMLSQMGAQEQAVSTAGGITAPISGMGALARGLTSFGGSYLSGKAERDAAALDKASLENAADKAEALYTLGGIEGGTFKLGEPAMETPMQGIPDSSKVQPRDIGQTMPREITLGDVSLGAPSYEDQQRLLRGYRRSSDPNLRQVATDEGARIEAERDRAETKAFRDRPVYRENTEYGGVLVDPITQKVLQSFGSNVKPSANYHTATPEELKGYPLGTTAQYNETTNKLEEIHEPNQGNRFTINTGKTISDQIVEKGIGLVTDSQSAAQGAVDNKTTNANMLKLLDTNKVIAGPAANFGLFINQVFGKDPEKLVATRGIIKGLAETTVQARKQFKGQGQISDFETRTLEKAVSGNIDNLTVAEIRAVISANNKMNGIVINRHNSLMAKASGAFKSKDPQDFLKLFQVEESTQDRKPWGTQ